MGDHDLKQALASARYAERVYRLAMEEPDTYPAVSEEIEEDTAEEEANRHAKWIAVLHELPDETLDDLLCKLTPAAAVVMCDVLDEKPIEDIAISFLIEFDEVHSDDAISEMIRNAFASIARHLGPFSKIGRELDARLSACTDPWHTRPPYTTRCPTCQPGMAEAA